MLINGSARQSGGGEDEDGNEVCSACWAKVEDHSACDAVGKPSEHTDGETRVKESSSSSNNLAAEGLIASPASPKEQDALIELVTRLQNRQHKHGLMFQPAHSKHVGDVTVPNMGIPTCPHPECVNGSNHGLNAGGRRSPLPQGRRLNVDAGIRPKSGR